MLAGYGRSDITPPLGTPMGGWGIPAERLSEVNNDPIYVRALYLVHEDEEALILTYDFCFVSREDADRLKGVLGREFGLLPERILMNASHTHAGPGVGSYNALFYTPPLRDYLSKVEAGTVAASREAIAGRKEVRVRTGMARTTVPMNRRQFRDGKIVNGPNPEGQILDSLPICAFEGLDGETVALLFAASCHPVCVPGLIGSADYPGAAMAELDDHFGKPCSIFLQGAGGDSRPRLLGEGRDTWNYGCGPEEARQVGHSLAQEVIQGMQAGLPSVPPTLRCSLFETNWPLQDDLTRDDYEQIVGEATDLESMSTRERWAARQLELLEQGPLPNSVSILMQGFVLGENLRIVALEGELVCELGRQIEESYPEGVTLTLGYSNGEGLYLVTSAMLDEGGYEPGSAWEYGLPSSLAKGTEDVVASGLEELRRRGIT